MNEQQTVSQEMSLRIGTLARTFMPSHKKRITQTKDFTLGIVTLAHIIKAMTDSKRVR
jgi:hypothetical protein